MGVCCALLGGVFLSLAAQAKRLRLTSLGRGLLCLRRVGVQWVEARSKKSSSPKVIREWRVVPTVEHEHRYKQRPQQRRTNSVGLHRTFTSSLFGHPKDVVGYHPCYHCSNKDAYYGCCVIVRKLQVDVCD